MDPIYWLGGSTMWRRGVEYKVIVLANFTFDLATDRDDRLGGGGGGENYSSVSSKGFSGGDSSTSWKITLRCSVTCAGEDVIRRDFLFLLGPYAYGRPCDFFPLGHLIETHLLIWSVDRFLWHPKSVCRTSETTVKLQVYHISNMITTRQIHHISNVVTLSPYARMFQGSHLQFCLASTTSNRHLRPRSLSMTSQICCNFETTTMFQVCCISRATTIVQIHRQGHQNVSIWATQIWPFWPTCLPMLDAPNWAKHVACAMWPS